MSKSSQQNDSNQAVINKKVKELSNFLTNSTKKKSDSILPKDQFAHSLFERAPSSFLESMTVQSLAAVTEECYGACDSFLSREDSVFVSASQGEDFSTITAIMNDCPFIVNTVVLSVRECGSDLQLLLYPLITLKGGRRLSVMYCHIDKLETNTLNLLQDRVQRSLADLSLVTEDHPDMLSHVETVARLLKEPIPSLYSTEQERHETSELMRWFSDGGFIFLGFGEWEVEHETNPDKEEVRFLDEMPKEALGYFRSTNHWAHDLITECRRDVIEALNDTKPLVISRLLQRSTVHRAERMNHVILPQYSHDGSIRSLISIVGIFTSKSLSQEASTIPTIRDKVKSLIAEEHAIPNTFAYKNIIKIVDSMPKELLLRSDTSILKRTLSMITSIQRESQSGSLALYDQSGKGVFITVVMPRKRFSEQVRSNLQKHIEYTFGITHDSSDLHVALNVKPLVLAYYHVPIYNESKGTINLQTLEKELIEITKSWHDSLIDALANSKDIPDPANICLKYQTSFSDEYQASTSVTECMQDISMMETLSADNLVRVDISSNEELSDGLFHLSLYSWKREMAISHVLPALENSGLHIIREQAFEITAPNTGPIFLHRFVVLTKDKASASIVSFKKNLCSGLEAILKDEVDNDILNSLLINSDLDIKSINLLRTFCAYSFQISTFTSKGTIRNTLATVPAAAALLWNMFEVKFNPGLKLSIDKRIEKLDALKKHFLSTLRSVPDITQDRILRIFANLLEATVRTNFYTGRSVIALKVDPSKIEILSAPKPYFEIFVRGYNVEGIHIRFGSVARGGIRWSDRRDDFRNEVLGLAKTQKVKNVVIVPTGSKGGFIVRRTPDTQDKLLMQVEECYREYIRALLSITDNRVKGTVKHPDNLVVFDNEDPYFVVAADKGTATFSDTANKIATEEFNFWLGDAFASGGSNGYDHKLYAITARGAWECVKRHFRDLSIRFETEPFTVTGIGDMSGDVFGNGLLYSDKIKLIAAFNHKHIFIDPTPDPELSYIERKRLFEMPRSQWTDYNQDLISHGGGVFGRFEKEITITNEVREALSLPSTVPDVLNGEQLVSQILKAKVDLLWNGGIGTYIKASNETNADVNDGTNDSVRIDAHELRSRVVAEGGNLGLTQRARIEFERLGGRINTDAIDNSGGVDLSDHEVNYKIFFTRLLEESKLSLDERNSVLKEVSTFACKEVLNNNASHALLLSLGSRRSLSWLSHMKEVIRDLSHAGYLNRTLDYLPDDESLDKLQASGTGLSRPELSRIYAALKMHLKESMITSGLCSDAALLPFLNSYFPPQICEKWPRYIEEHPLKPQIIATKVINEVVDFMGATFVHRTQKTLSVEAVDILTGYLVARQLIDLPALREDLSQFDTPETPSVFLDLNQEINNLLTTLITGLVGNISSRGSIRSLYESIESTFNEATRSVEAILSAASLIAFSERIQRYISLGLSGHNARRLALGPVMNLICEIVSLRIKSGRSVKDTARAYNSVVSQLGIEDLLNQLDQFSVPNRWDRELLAANKITIRDSIRTIVNYVAMHSHTETASADVSGTFNRIRELATDLTMRGINISAVTLLAEELRKHSRSLQTNVVFVNTPQV